MQKTVVALALLEQVNAFSAPVVRTRQVKMFEEGDIGVLPPLGVYDPLGLIEKRDMRRYEIMEIKHGRAAMLGFLHVIHIESGVRFPGYISGSAGLKFTDVPGGLIASLEGIPTLGWLQIMAVACACETGYAGRPWSVVAQAPDREVRKKCSFATLPPLSLRAICRLATLAVRAGCVMTTRR
jgi:light-harvesting complex I chlorophyll a/b binding protein 1